jgi:rod shape-determining protein MreD
MEGSSRGFLFVKVVLVLLVAAALEGQVPLYWPPSRYVDLPLIVTVYFALMRDPFLGMLVGCAAGLAGDLAPGAGPIVGVGGFSKTVIGFVIASVGVRFSLEGPLMRVIVLALASLVNSLLFVGLYELLDQEVMGDGTAGDLARTVGFEMAANLLLGVFIFVIFDKIFPEKSSQGQMRVRRRFYD